MTPPQKSRTRTAVAVTAVCLGGVLIAGPLVGSHVAAQDLTPKASDALKGTPVSVSFAGREATLSGGGLSAEEQAEAISIVEDVYGVRWATFDGDHDSDGADGATDGSSGPDDGATASELRIETVDGVVHVTGRVDSRETADRILADAREAFGDTVVDDIVVDADAARPAWLTGLPDVLSAVAPVDGLGLELGSDSVELSGTAPSEEAGAQAVDALAKALPDTTVVDRLAIAEGLDADDAAALADLSIPFDSDSTAVTPAGAAALDQLVAILEANPSATVGLVGHSAVATGPEEAEVAFSATRAQAAADYLVQRGIAAERLTVSGAGTSSPVGDPATPEGRAANRRVTVIETQE